MPIVYNVIPNALTVPPSYTCRPTPNQIMDYDDVAEAINVRNPTIPVATAKSVLEAFRTETLNQLADGNSINLSGFLSLVVSMPVRLDTPVDLLPSNPIDVKAKPSTPFKTAVRQLASYSRDQYVEKQPSVLHAADTHTEIDNYISDGFGFVVNGTNVGFDKTNPDEGIFITDADGLEMKQVNVSLNNPSSLIFIPDFTGSAVETFQVEKTLSVKSKYTENGQIRTGVFSKKQRSLNVIAEATSPHLFIVGDSTDAVCSVTDFTLNDVDAYFEAIIHPDNSLTLNVATIEGVQGDEITLTGVNGQEFVLTGLAADVTLYIVDYDVLYASVLSYGRYMREVCNLSIIGGV